MDLGSERGMRRITAKPLYGRRPYRVTEYSFKNEFSRGSIEW
jgi:hypothetical protein